MTGRCRDETQRTRVVGRNGVLGAPSFPDLHFLLAFTNLRHLDLNISFPALRMQSTPPDGEEAAGTAMLPKQSLAPVQVPRISIRFCTQCQWMLRAAYVCSKFVVLHFFQPFSLFFLLDVSVPKRSLSSLIVHFVNQLLLRDFFARSGAFLPLMDSEYLSIETKNPLRFVFLHVLFWR